MRNPRHTAIARHCLLIAACAATSALAQRVDPQSSEQLFERLSTSVWTVGTFDAKGQPQSLGNAVVIGPGSLVTNCHILPKASRISVSDDSVSYAAALEHADAERDLCLLRARNLRAPAVKLGSLEGVKAGSRVYAIGSLRGQQQTLSEGLLSDVRSSDSGEVTALEITVPPSKALSGGGLFDAQGRLIGITSPQMGDAPGVSFALPANWVATAQQRAKEAQGARPEPRKAAPAAVAAAPAASPSPATVFEYELRDRLTGKVRPVVYRLDLDPTHTDAGKRFFNGGTRVESSSGEVLSVSPPIAGEADDAMPPGGWFKVGAAIMNAGAGTGASWKLDYSAGPMRLDLKGRVVGEPTLQLAGRQLRTVQIEFDGYVDRLASSPGVATGHYRATAWYSPELTRLVRFSVYTRGGVGPRNFLIDEQLELTAIR